MKTNKIVLMCFAALMLTATAGNPFYAQADDNPDETPAAIAAVESGEIDLLLADISQVGEGGVNISAAYAELKDLARQYRESRTREAKERVANRAEDVMGQLFDAKVQVEARRIEAMEKRLDAEKQRLKDMQSHKVDLVKKAVSRALENGEMPEWAPSRESSPE